MISGWITPEGKVVEVKSYEHFKEVDDKVLKDIWEEYSDEIQASYDSCQALQDSGEHGEWHMYEMCQDRCTRWAYEDAYKLGYLRLTPWNYRGELPGIGVEGLPQWFETHKTIMKELTDKHDCRIKTFPVEMSRRY